MINKKIRKTKGEKIFFLSIIIGVTIISLLTISFKSKEKTPLSSKAAPSGMKVGSILFSWYYCPPDGRTCTPDSWKYDPPGTSNPYPDGSYYNPTNPSWWKIEVSDMTCAGVDIVFLHLWEPQYVTNFSGIVNAINTLNAPLKIALYWDATFAGSGDLGDTANTRSHYDRFIKPFYQQMPRNLWAMENNKPILYIYKGGPSYFTNIEKTGDFFQNIKNYFKEDFGTEPFLILGNFWFDGTNSAESVADAINQTFPSATCDGGNAKIHSLRGYTTTTIAAGAWDDFHSNGCHLERNDDGVFRLGFSQVPGNNNLLVVESWNELVEGSGMERMENYPKNGGGYLPPTYYLNTLRNLLGRNDRPACRSLAEILGREETPPTATTAPTRYIPPTQAPTNPTSTLFPTQFINPSPTPLPTSIFPSPSTIQPTSPSIPSPTTQINTVPTTNIIINPTTISFPTFIPPTRTPTPTPKKLIDMEKTITTVKSFWENLVSSFTRFTQTVLP